MFPSSSYNNCLSGLGLSYLFISVSHSRKATIGSSSSSKFPCDGGGDRGVEEKWLLGLDCR